MKRIIFFILILICSIGARAQQYDFTAVTPSGHTLCYSYISDAEGSTVSVRGNDTSISGHLEIPATVTHDNHTYAVAEIGDWAFKKCKRLTSVSIPNSVSSIGPLAFCSCGFTSIVIPEGVTTINRSTFWGCGRRKPRHLRLQQPGPSCGL